MRRGGHLYYDDDIWMMIIIIVEATRMLLCQLDIATVHSYRTPAKGSYGSQLKWSVYCRL